MNESYYLNIFLWKFVIKENMIYIWKNFPREIIKGDNVTESGFNYEEEYEKRVYKKVWMDIAWYCGRNGRRILILALCGLFHGNLPYHFFSCQQFHLGGGNGGIVAQFIYAGA